MTREREGADWSYSWSLLARIIAVADVYDAMTSDRPYRKALPPAEAFAYLSDGAMFDREVVGALRTVVDEGTAATRRPAVVDLSHSRVELGAVAP